MCARDGAMPVAELEKIPMKVRELIELLQAQNLDAEVCMVTGANWPMEHDVAGVAARMDMVDDEVDPARQERYSDGTAASDVVLVEGRWLRYGNKAAWKAVR